MIDPTKFSFNFSFEDSDCYKLLSGRCTFELSEEEYREEMAKCNHPFYFEGRVGYCREIYNSMKKDNAFSKSTGIRAFRFGCGHIEFSEGQHRACIAQKLNINELFLDYLGDNGEYLCSSCFSKGQRKTTI